MAFSWLMVGAALWAATSALEELPLSDSMRVLLAKIQYLSINTVPPLWFLGALRFGNPERWLTNGIRALVWSVPCLTLVLAWTNESHHLIWTGLTVVQSLNGDLNPIFGHGPMFYVAVSWHYVLVFGGAILNIRSTKSLPILYRAQAAACVGVAILPVFANAAYVAGVVPWPGFDLTPVAFGLVGVGAAWSMFRLRLFELGPIARDTLVESMTDGVLVVDPRGRVVDFNARALTLLSIPAQRLANSLLGKPIQELLAEAGVDPPAEPLSPKGFDFRSRSDRPLHLDVQVVPVPRAGADPVGYLLVLRDVTAQRTAEAALVEANLRLHEHLREIEALQAELKEQALRDVLTGLFNRRQFEDVLRRELAEAEAANTPVAIVLLDLDLFKSINDTYGHLTGDALLRQVGRLLTFLCPEGATCCRYGGEEFVLILPRADAASALKFVEQLRKTFRATPFAAGSEQVALTLSGGIASYPEHAAAIDALIERADRALYDAKQLGRDRVVLATPSPSGLPSASAPSAVCA